MEKTMELIRYIQTSPKKTPVKVYYSGQLPEAPEGVRVFAFGPQGGVVIGDYDEVKPFLDAHAATLTDVHIECDRRLSAIPLLDVATVQARIEPGSIIREHVTIAPGAIVMMGAVINIGAVVGEGTMIDMNATIGGRVHVGRMCHIGAGAVLAGVIEPPSAQPVVIEDDVLIGANAVVLEGVRVGTGAVVAAGAVVVDDVAPHTVVAGVPARWIKNVDDKTKAKTELMMELRQMAR
jgi:tetrahydrodipicolinate N-acetyltransferase